MESIYMHKSARLAANDQLKRILTVGSYREHANSEWYDYGAKKWVQTSALYAFPTGVWECFLCFTLLFLACSLNKFEKNESLTHSSV